MPRVKICGVKRPADIAAVVKSGGDAIGLNFVTRSPRFVGGIAKAAALIRESRPPQSLLLCGVFVNAPLAEICEAAGTLRLNVIQLHGEETPQFVSDVSARYPDVQIWKAVRVATHCDLAILKTFACHGWVLDSKVEGLHGGSGQAFDWSLLEGVNRTAQVILSGGLRPDNISAAIQQTAPDWVDVASGVESAPGEKSHELIEDFIRRAKAKK